MNDFSTNRPAETTNATRPEVQGDTNVIRHPDIWFSDGNIVLVAGQNYFRVHLGLLCRHSIPLKQAVATLVETKTCKIIEGHVALEVTDKPKDLYIFLLALYDGTSGLKFDAHDFESVSALLRLSTKYGVGHIRRDILRGLSAGWPRTLSSWEFREADATDNNGSYKPRSVYPHPVLVINLARQANAPELLPSAFYDLSRSSASEIAMGCKTTNSSGRIEHHILSDEDLMNALKGREHASRFLSTFIVSELEGRDLSSGCIYKNDPDSSQKRICQATFEATTFEVLRDVNGVAFDRSSDPLFAIMDADLMQARNDGTNGRLTLLNRACESCRVELTNSVDAAREEMWGKLPGWFGVNVPNWH